MLTFCHRQRKVTLCKISFEDKLNLHRFISYEVPYIHSLIIFVLFAIGATVALVEKSFLLEVGLQLPTK